MLAFRRLFVFVFVNFIVFLAGATALPENDLLRPVGSPLEPSVITKKQINDQVLYLKKGYSLKHMQGEPIVCSNLKMVMLP